MLLSPMTVNLILPDPSTTHMVPPKILSCKVESLSFWNIIKSSQNSEVPIEAPVSNTTGESTASFKYTDWNLSGFLLLTSFDKA